MGNHSLGHGEMVATFRRFETFNASALWFFSGGIVLVLTGSVNLLNRPYAPIAPGLKWCCRATNIAIFAFTGVSGPVTHATLAELTAVLGFMGAMTLLSWMRPSHVVA
jgi:hypothetical protein